MKILLGASSLLLLLLASPAAGQEFRLKEEASAVERPLPDGGWTRTVVHPRFDFVNLWKPGQEKPTVLLLAQRLESTMRSDTEGAQPTLQVTAWTKGKRAYDKKLWSFTAEADLGELVEADEYFRTTRHGCCAAEQTHTLYNLETGKPIVTYTDEGVGFLEVPNTPVRRQVAYHSQAASLPSPDLGDAQGILTLSTRSDVIHKIAVHVGNNEIGDFTPVLSLKVNGEKEEESRWIDLWAAEKNPVSAAIGGFEVKLVFGNGQAIRIPVTGDDFDLTKATVPPAFRLVRLK
jgi:hypothetical protein